MKPCSFSFFFSSCRAWAWELTPQSDPGRSYFGYAMELGLVRTEATHAQHLHTGPRTYLRMLACSSCAPVLRNPMCPPRSKAFPSPCGQWPAAAAQAQSRWHRQRARCARRGTAPAPTNTRTRTAGKRTSQRNREEEGSARTRLSRMRDGRPRLLVSPELARAPTATPTAAPANATVAVPTICSKDCSLCSE